MTPLTFQETTVAKSKTTKGASPTKKTTHEEFMEATCETQCHELRIALIDSATKVVTVLTSSDPTFVAASAFLKSWYESDTPETKAPSVDLIPSEAVAPAA